MWLRGPNIRKYLIIIYDGESVTAPLFQFYIERFVMALQYSRMIQDIIKRKSSSGHVPGNASFSSWQPFCFIY